MKELGVMVWALCMWLNGDLVEHTYQKSMVDCMKNKRVAMRTINPEHVKFACGQVKADIEHIEEIGDTTGRIRIIKVIDHSYKNSYQN
tara:strand:- start:920 stop:1183 length:264 start_codon:yes stop_codon:yes gene_type:complete